MTVDETQTVIAKALQQEESPALLSGKSAKVAMFCFALLLVVGPMLYYIPEFAGWRDVVGWVVALLIAASGPAITLLIPTSVQERYRQAVVRGEEERKQMHREMVELRAMAHARRAEDKTGG